MYKQENKIYPFDFNVCVVKSNTLFGISDQEFSSNSVRKESVLFIKI